MNGSELRRRYLLDYYCCLRSKPALWPNLMSLPKVEKFGYKWKEGGIVVKGKGVNKWVMVIREIQYYINTLKEARGKRWHCLLAQLYQMPWKGKAIYCCSWNLRRCIVLEPCKPQWPCSGRHFHAVGRQTVSSNAKGTGTMPASFNY